MEKGKKAIRLSKVARDFNVGISTIIDFLTKKGIEVDSNPNFKISPEAYKILEEEYRADINVKKESEKLNLRKKRETREIISLDDMDENQEEAVETEAESQDSTEVLIEDHSSPSKESKEKEPVEADEPKKAEPEVKQEKEVKQKKEAAPEKKEEKAPEQKEKKTDQVKIIGKIDLEPKKKEAKKEEVKPETTQKESLKLEEKPETKKEPVKEEKPKAEPKEKAEQKTEVKKEEKPAEAKIKEEKPKAEEKKTDKEKPEATKDKPQKKAEEKTVTPEKEKQEKPAPIEEKPVKVELDTDLKVVGKIDLDSINQRTRPPKKTKKQKEEERKNRQKQEAEKRAKTQEGNGQAGNAGDPNSNANRKKKRKRIKKDPVSINDVAAGKNKRPIHKKGRPVKGRTMKQEVSEEDVQKQIKDTLARLTSKGKSKSSKYRRQKRDEIHEKQIREDEQKAKEKNLLKATEFVTVNELAQMMNVQVNQVISSCMSLGLFVSINQRLDAETLVLVAEEFGYEVEFVSHDLKETIEQEEEPINEEDLVSRPPIVTVMGHVDHGKTSLLDHIRHSNVIAGEAGGITQHIGAYNVTLKDGKKITFLDTPGHEAFTAMRARGAQITDIAIIVVAADDNIMPQTVEAINHAAAAGVPIVFAINKIDKPGANPEKIKEGLANMNYLVEDWGGKYQSQDISAKKGEFIDELLDKVLLEAEMLELKGDPARKATGTVIESSLDKGRGYVTTLLVQNGTLRQQDIILAGAYTGRVKAMYNERNQPIDQVGPSEPVLMLGLNGAPQAGDKFNIMESERDAKEIALKRHQLQREQGLRTQKHITLDEIGRRIAIGNFQELNIIVKGDVDGSIEALSDSLIKLSTEEIQVNIIHKAVGQITEYDIMLATASNAIIVGFQVRPSLAARKIAEKEGIDIRLYSIIYDAINEIRDAMEGMLSPDIKEEITGTCEIRETFKITKVGTIAGCYVKDGKIHRNNKIRIIRDGIVVYTSTLGSLKRFKDDVKEVASGYECGLNIDNYNDIKVGDIIECFVEKEERKTLN